MRLLSEKFPAELVVISVHSAKFPTEKLTGNIRQAIMRHGLDHPVVNDADFQLWQAYAVRAWPTVVLIAPQGKIVHTQAGEILAGEFIPKIEALIGESESKGLLDRTPLDLRSERSQEPLRPLSYPAKLLLADEGLLYVADTGHHRILELKLSEDGLSGEIRRVFGSGRPGLQDGLGAEAAFHGPRGLAQQQGTLYVADTDNHAIRAIDLAGGRVRTVAGTGQKAHGRFKLGQPTEVALRSPWALWAQENIVLIAMAGSHQIWALVNEERLGPFAGTGQEALLDGPLAEAAFNQPSDLAAGFGHLFVADSEASAIRAISLGEEPQVITLIGQGLFEFGDVDGAGHQVRLQHPAGLAFYVNMLYVADTYNHKLKTLDPTTGEVKTLIGSGRPGQADGPFDQAELFEPEGVAAGEGRLYIADTNNHLVRVADLKERMVRTLTLTGLEQLAPAAPLTEAAPARRLAPLTVGPGEVEIKLQIDLPPGYKLNPEAPQLLRVKANGTSTSHTFAAAETPSFKVAVDATTDLDLNLTVYYCETGDQRLCLIHDARFLLPLAVEAGAGANAVIRYEIEA